MEQSGCPVSSSSEAPFVMSQLLSKLDGKDSVEFGREMQRTGKVENVSNLIDWLLSEASLRSRIKRETNYHRSNSGVRSNDSDTYTDEKCPLQCGLRHLLSACPIYQKADANRRWEIVKQNNRCRKCLRAHHTNSCKKNLMALLATNASDAITDPYIMRVRQRQSPDKILKMHQLQMQAKKPLITIFKGKEVFSLFALSKR